MAIFLFGLGANLHHPSVQASVRTDTVRAVAEQRKALLGSLRQFGDVTLVRSQGSTYFTVNVAVQGEEIERKLLAFANQNPGILDISRGTVQLFPDPKDIRYLENVKHQLAEFTKNGHDSDSKPKADDENDGPSKGAKMDKDEDGPDYLRSLEYYLSMRAFPYARIDYSAYDRAQSHIAKMPIGNLGHGVPSPLSSHESLVNLSRWHYLGPNNLDEPYQTYYGVPPSSGRINAVAYDPLHTGTWYVGGAEGGLWKTIDSGAHWYPYSNTWASQMVGSIAVDPTNSNVVYVGMGDYPGYQNGPVGIYRTTNAGGNWTLLGNSSFGNRCVTSIIVDPTDPNQISISTADVNFGGAYLFHSTNQGATWTQTNSPSENWMQLAISIPNSSGVRTYYAAGLNTSNGVDLYRSTDKGVTWTKASTPANTQYNSAAICASTVDPNTVYFFDTYGRKVLKSTNNGSTWTSLTYNLGSVANFSQSWYDYELTARKVGNADSLVLGLIDVLELQPGATSWAPIGITETNSAKTHNDQHAVQINPANPNEMLVANDGGVYLATYSNSTWSFNPVNRFLGLSMFYDGSFVHSDDTRMIAGAQDMATPVSTGDLSHWQDVAGGDGGFVAINQYTPNRQYATIYNFDIITTANGWANSQDISPSLSGDSLPFVTPIYIDPTSSAGDIYGATNHLHRYNASSGTWSLYLDGSTNLSGGGMIHSIAVAPNNANTIYTGSDQGTAYVTFNRATSWKSLNSAGLPSRPIGAISPDPLNANDVLIGFGGTGVQHLYHCSNTSFTSPSFGSVSGSGSSALPDLPINAILRDPTSPELIWYVGTDLGVFMTTNAGVNWTNITNAYGLPAVQVTALEMRNDGTMGAATYGRGMWAIATAFPRFESPYAVRQLIGHWLYGTLESLYQIDGNTYSFQTGTTKFKTQDASFVTLFKTPTTGSSNIKLHWVVTSGASNVATVYALNQVTHRYDTLETVNLAAGTSSRTDTIVSTGANVSNYIGAGGVLTLLIDHTGAAGTSQQTISYDTVGIEVN